MIAPLPGVARADAILGLSAEVAELADAQDLGSCGREAVGVQLPPSAPASRFMIETISFFASIART